MPTSDRLLRWLCWGLVVAAVVSAISQLLITFGIWAGGPTEPDAAADLVDRLLVFRGNDQEIFPVVLIGGIASVAAFLLIGLVGVTLRSWAAGRSGRDNMATLFVAAAVVGVVSQVLGIAVAQAATFGYCDCGYKTEEVIAQEYALSIGFIAAGWLTNAAFVLVGIGVGVAGRLVAVSSPWRLLSYAIALIALIATVVRILASLVSFGGLDVVYWSDVVVGVSTGILVPAWAILLARSADRPGSATTAA